MQLLLLLLLWLDTWEDVAECNYHPSFLEVEARGPGIQGHFQIDNEFWIV